ncbi:MAG TPA: hypothetical protein VH117_04120 [Edaphobacter sp.]|nr:hypothetical protein [Edaphobacter sp.]
MDHAVQKVFGYLGRHKDCPDRKLAWRIKGVIKRRARQQSKKTSREIQYGSLLDLEKVYVGQSEAEQRIYVNEVFARLSPFAQSIVEWRWLGYSWRKIAEHLDMDHTAVRRAYKAFNHELLVMNGEEGSTEPARDNVSDIAENRESELVLFLCRERVVGKLFCQSQSAPQWLYPSP